MYGFPEYFTARVYGFPEYCTKGVYAFPEYCTKGVYAFPEYCTKGVYAFPEYFTIGVYAFPEYLTIGVYGFLEYFIPGFQREVEHLRHDPPVLGGGGRPRVSTATTDQGTKLNTSSGTYIVIPPPSPSDNYFLSFYLNRIQRNTFCWKITLN